MKSVSILVLTLLISSASAEAAWKHAGKLSDGTAVWRSDSLDQYWTGTLPQLGNQSDASAACEGLVFSDESGTPIPFHLPSLDTFEEADIFGIAEVAPHTVNDNFWTSSMSRERGIGYTFPTEMWHVTRVNQVRCVGWIE